MRKRSKYRPKYRPPGFMPITLDVKPAVRANGDLLVHESLAALLDHSGTAEHVELLLSIALYCVRMCERLHLDDSVDEDGLADAVQAAEAGSDAIVSVQQRLCSTGRVGCTGPEREALRRLVELNEALDAAATRRQCRDVATTLWPTREAAHA